MNKKELFLRVYRNIVLNKIINNQIRRIHKRLYKKDKKLNWKQLIDSPQALAQYGYFDYFKLQFDSLAATKFYTYYTHRDLIAQCGQPAARNGHLQILKYIVEYSTKDLHSAIDMIFQNALSGGHFHIIRYIHLKLNHYSYYDYFYYAAMSGNVAVCELFTAFFKDCSNFNNLKLFFNGAALSGSVEVMKWGIQYFNRNLLKYCPSGVVWTNALKSNNIALLDFMYSHEEFKNSFNVSIIDGIKFCTIEVIDWILSKDIVLSTTYYIKELKYLIDRSSLKIIYYILTKLLHLKVGDDHKSLAKVFFKCCIANGFNAIDYTIREKNFKIMKWFFENTSYNSTINPFKEFVYNFDTLYKDLKKYNKFKTPEIIPYHSLQSLLITRDQMNILDYFIRNQTDRYTNEFKIELRHVLDYILLNSESMELAEWMVKHTKDECSNQAMNSAIFLNRLEAVKWIHENTTMGCSKIGIHAAYFLYDSKMVEWLHKNRTESCNAAYIRHRFFLLSKPIQNFVVHNRPDMIPFDILDQIKDDIQLTNIIIEKYPNQFIYDY